MHVSCKGKQVFYLHLAPVGRSWNIYKIKPKRKLTPRPKATLWTNSIYMYSLWWLTDPLHEIIYVYTIYICI